MDGSDQVFGDGRVISGIDDQPSLCHVEDVVSLSHWNTPFRVKVNLYGKAFDATLDTGASLSAVQSEVDYSWGTHTIKAVVRTSYSACRWRILLPTGCHLVVFGFHRSALLSSVCCSSKSFFSCHSWNGLYAEISGHTSCSIQNGGAWR